MQGIDIAGRRFGRLIAIKLILKEERIRSNKKKIWLCKCDCGKETLLDRAIYKEGDAHDKSVSW